jgi:terminase, large subunit
MIQSATAAAVRTTIRTWKPPPKLDLDEWADRYFVLSAESAAEPGRWRSIPYQRGIMKAFNDPEVERISVMKSARVGYTKILDIAIGYHMHQDPCPMLVVQPTIDDAQGYSKDEIAPMVRDTPVLQGLVSDGYRDSSNTILKKTFPGGVLNLVGANSARGFRRLTVRLVLLDEVDGYPPTAGDEGDQITLATRRSDTFWNRKIVLGSTPTIQGVSRIEASFLESDRRRYYVPCPHCGEFQYLVWDRMKWPDGNPERAYYQCIKCDQPIDHAFKRQMVERGEWRAEAPFRGHAGFHIWAAYSYSPNATWAKLATEWCDVQKDRERLKTFVNTVIGEPWVDKGEQVEGALLHNRRELYRAPVPNGSILTAGVDVQKDRLEAEIVAWGEGEESWSIEYLRIIGDPSRAELWDAMAAALGKTWLRVDGAQLDVRALCIDSGGHFTDEVYSFSRKHGVRWAIPIKGSSEAGKPIAAFPRTMNKKRVYLTMLGVDTGKELLMRRLGQEETGPGYCHFPNAQAYDEEYFAQLTAEKAITRYKAGRPFIEWQKTRPRNEALDCRIYAHAAVRILQQHGGVRLETINPEDYDPDPAPLGRGPGPDRPAAVRPDREVRGSASPEPSQPGGRKGGGFINPGGRGAWIRRR